MHKNPKYSSLIPDNHEQLSNSSSHSTTHATNNITTSTTNVLPVTKKTDHHESKQTGSDAGHDDAGGGADSANEDKGSSSTGGAGGKDTATHSELMIEPKNEYDDDDGTEPVEDLTLDDEDMMEDLDQAGPSHGGEGSSSGSFCVTCFVCSPNF